MEQDSILKRSLVLTGAIVGISAVWVALVSLVLVLVTGRVLSGLDGSRSGGGSSSVEAPVLPADHAAVPRGMFSPQTNVTSPKPNG
jgi:hypothetical protein